MCKFQGRVIFLKRDIQPRGIFMPLYFFSKKPCIYKFVNSKKNTSDWKIFFLRIPSPRIPRQVGRVQMSRLCDFCKARYPAAGHFYAFIFFQKNLYLQVCKFEKKILPFGIFFLRIPSPRILRQVGHVQIARSWYLF